MEHVTRPEQVVFLGVLFVVFCVVAWWWLRSGVSKESTPVDFNPTAIVGDTWRAILHWRPVPMSSKYGGDHALDNNDDRDNAPATTTPQNSNNSIATPATDSNALLLAQARALAIMVKAGKVGETEGIKLVFDVSPSSSNPRYIAARAALKSELEKIDNPFPHMTPEQKKAREALGLNKSTVN